MENDTPQNCNVQIEQFHYVFECNQNQTHYQEYDLVWFDFCFTALQNILGYFGRGQLT